MPNMNEYRYSEWKWENKIPPRVYSISSLIFLNVIANGANNFFRPKTISKVAVITTNNLRLRSAGDNDRRSRRFCSITELVCFADV